jgi:predicted aspartyl protease
LGDEETTPVRFASTPAIPLVLVFAFALSIQGQSSSARVAMQKMSGVPVVQVLVNGTGPYPFVLDTGANVTVIKRQLLRNLNMPGIASVTIAATLGDSPHQRTEAATLAIAGLSVEHIEINALEDGQLGALEGHVQGILGENFLKYFDLLIDNDHHALTLDRTTNLESSFAGEHLPVSRTGTYNSAPTLDRVVIRLQLAVLARPVFFLLDSGTNTVMLFPGKQEAPQVSWSSGRGNIHSLNMVQNCGVQRTTLAIGGQTLHDVVLAACKDRMRDRMDTDGLLSTGIFHRLFLCHHRDYVIANPHPVERAGSPAVAEKSADDKGASVD